MTNNEFFNQRMDFVRSILTLNGLKVNSIKPVKYDPQALFVFENNYIYHITLESPNASPKSVISQTTKAKINPHTSPIPAGCNSVIVRLSNTDPKTGINNANRVENEVACMTLARQALAGSVYSHIIPDIYAWQSISEGQGFIMMQFMEGEVPNKALKKMGLDAKSVVFRQMAEILALIQKFEIPKTIESFGGLKVNLDGEAISAEMTLRVGEPSASYGDLIRSLVAGKLEEADNNPVIKGWNENRLRTRLDRFIEFGLPQMLENLKNQRKVLVHSDFTTNNLLFDPVSSRITALLDFDFSYVGTVAEEFLGFSFSGMYGGQLPGPDSEPFELLIREAMLAGFPESLPTFDSEESTRQWKLAKVWNVELARSGAARPQTIELFDKIADIYWLADNLSPFDLENVSLRQQRTENQLRARREEIARTVGKFLSDAGF